MKVYNIAKYIEKECEGYTAFHYEKVMMFEGKAGWVLSEYEYIHFVPFISKKETIRIPVCPVPTIHEDGHRSISIMETGYVVCSLNEVLTECEYEEMEPKDFFRYIGSKWRLQDNYRELCKSLREIEFEFDADWLEGGK